MTDRMTGLWQDDRNMIGWQTEDPALPISGCQDANKISFFAYYGTFSCFWRSCKWENKKTVCCEPLTYGSGSGSLLFPSVADKMPTKNKFFSKFFFAYLFRYFSMFWRSCKWENKKPIRTALRILSKCHCSVWATVPSGEIENDNFRKIHLMRYRSKKL